MGLSAAKLDRRIQFRRRTLVDNGLGMVEVWADHGPLVFASRSDVSDGEKFVAGWNEATIDTRFIVRANTFTNGITPIDRLICEGRDFDIIGIKQVGERYRWLEITGKARAE